jgi:HNH endonuclease
MKRKRKESMVRFELVLLIVTGLIISNIYTDGYVYRKALSYKKYYEMTGVIIVALFIYYVIQKNPKDSRKIMMSSNEYLKYLPIDKNASDILTPIMNFTSSLHNNTSNLDTSLYTQSLFQPTFEGAAAAAGAGAAAAAAKLGIGESKTTKRVVSETKKKFVAAKQNWRCNDCMSQLNAWFEIDHIVRLDQGGSNHVDNLAALCRECHGKKTTIENL